MSSNIEELYREKAVELLASEEVKLVIGYRAGTTAGRRRALFARSGKEAARLCLDDHCNANLAGYLVTEGLLADRKKVAVFLRPEGIRSVNVLAAESQLDPAQVVILGFEERDGAIGAIEGRHIDDFAPLITELKADIQHREKPEQLEAIENMSAEERFAFWKKEFERCIKCYACRQVCPMCYCKRCVTDNNQPQWIHTSSHTLGNFEWNLIRALHLSGRCVECGGCDRACPANIPLRLINRRMAQEVLESFDHFSGISPAQEPVLASFRTDDPETFIL